MTEKVQQMATSLNGKDGKNFIAYSYMLLGALLYCAYNNLTANFSKALEPKKSEDNNYNYENKTLSKKYIKKNVVPQEALAKNQKPVLQKPVLLEPTELKTQTSHCAIFTNGYSAGQYRAEMKNRRHQREEKGLYADDSDASLGSWQPNLQKF